MEAALTLSRAHASADHVKIPQTVTAVVDGTFLSRWAGVALVVPSGGKPEALDFASSGSLYSWWSFA